MKLLFSEKIINKQELGLIKKEKVVSKETQVAGTFNEYFVNVVPFLYIDYNKDFL